MYCLNLIPIKSGGGQQNALSFLNHLLFSNKVNDFIVLTTHGTSVDDFCCTNHFNYISVRKSKRLWFELWGFRHHLKKGMKCFTFFGPPMIGSHSYLYNISGCAYSNIFYDDVDFWGYLPFFSKQKKKIIDIYRLWAVSASHEVIVETEDLLTRAKKKFPKKIIHLVKMAPTSNVDIGGTTFTDSYSFLNKISGYKILFFCGEQPNKRVLEFLFVLNELVVNKDFVMILTMNESSMYYKKIMNVATQLCLSDRIINVGTVQPEHASSLLTSVDFVANVALLESFSNNYIEAWKMRKPLIATDAQWAKNCCGDAAIFVDPLDPYLASKVILNEMDNINDYVNNGFKRLDEFPSKEEKNSLYMSILEQW